MAGLVLNSTAVLRLNFCTKLNICTSISATSPSCKPLPHIKMTRYSIILLTLIFFSCKQTNSSDKKTQESSLETNKEEMTEILLTETKLGDLELNKLTENNMLTEIKSAFPDFKVTKTVGQQDGPDFNLYQ